MEATRGSVHPGPVVICAFRKNNCHPEAKIGPHHMVLS